ncbi:hypothetical protein KKF55_05765 [Patescibacteria group bacterium]|nr:hypothetical protein [Patescibacteria group bacterium]
MANPIVDEFAVTKKLLAWAERAAKQGLDLSTDLQPSIDDPSQMQRLVRHMQAGCPQHGIVYDATAVSRILGLPAECNVPTPKPEDGEVVIYYGGWSLKELRESKAGQERMMQDQDWYEQHEWKAESGYYRLLLPVPNSNRKKWSEQTEHLSGIDAEWQPAPVCVAATALLVHLTEVGDDLLRNDWCRCEEALPDGDYVALDIDGGRVVVVCGLGGGRYGHLWLSAARKS